jgi:hypothetical protein
MAEAAQRVLMNEFKELSKETWTNIEVRLSVHSDEDTFLDRASVTCGAPS